MPRIRSSTVVGSPAAAAETVVAALSPGSIPVGQGGDPVDLIGIVDITIGTSGTAITVKIERGTVAGGTLLATVGPLTVVAANRYEVAIEATDNEVTTGYVLTATITGGAAVSTVGNVSLRADW